MANDAKQRFDALRDKWYPDNAGRANAAQMVVSAIVGALPQAKKVEPETRSANMEPVQCTVTLHNGRGPGDSESVHEITLDKAKAYLRASGPQIQISDSASTLRDVPELEYHAETRRYPDGVSIVTKALVEILELQLKAAPPAKRSPNGS